MFSTENLGFSETNFEVVIVHIFHPDCHGILGSVGMLVPSSHKYGWRGPETLKHKCSIITNNCMLKKDIYCKEINDFI